MCPFDVIFSANDSVFRAEHDPLLRTAYFLSKTRVLRVRKERSTLNLVPRYALHGIIYTDRGLSVGILLIIA